MSRVVHRQPVWTWSLVLFSALLFTPSTAALVLSALKQANVALAPSVESAVAPRRATAEELEPAAASMLAVLTPARNTFALLDIPVVSAQPRTCTTLLRSCTVAGFGSRAPPLA